MVIKAYQRIFDPYSLSFLPYSLSGDGVFTGWLALRLYEL